MSAIKLVQGDNYPTITLTLTDSQTGDALDLSASTTIVLIKFRAVNSTTLLSTITCAKPNGGSDGVVAFYFPNTTLDVSAGNYQGEIEINYNGQYMTIFDVLQFVVRAEF